MKFQTRKEIKFVKFDREERESWVENGDKMLIGCFGDYEFCAGKIKSERGNHITHSSFLYVRITHVPSKWRKETRTNLGRYFGKILAMWRLFLNVNRWLQGKAGFQFHRNGKVALSLRFLSCFAVDSNVFFFSWTLAPLQSLGRQRLSSSEKCKNCILMNCRIFSVG